MATVPLYLRCFVADHQKKGNFTPRNEPKPNDSIVLVFDTETNPDEAKNLVFGSCGIWVNEKLHRFYVFYDDGLKPKEIEKLRKICSNYKVTILSRKDFVDDVFYPYVFRARAKCVGFNLPFDISRLAINHVPSRKYPNGFSFKLSENPKNPNIVIKSKDTKSQFIEFTRPMRKKSERKKPHCRGYFVDAKTFAYSLTNNSYNLADALDAFDVPFEKLEPKKHGIISEQYVDYNINDTFATYYLYCYEMMRYRTFCLDKLESKLFSPASIGKGYLEKIGFKPFLEIEHDIPDEILGYIMTAYHGGRVETRIRNVPCRISYIDFTSMYPTIFVLLGMYSFLIAKKITHHYTTRKTQEFLNEIIIDDIANPDIWKKFTTICRIRPDDDILPARSNYSKQNDTTIGINYVKTVDGTSLWCTLPDLIASKLQSGKTPQIEEAITFVPEGIQDGLQEIEVLKGITVRPGEDFIKKIIEERLRIIKELENLDEQQQRQSEIKQKILKIIANATSYGIFFQIDTKNQKKKSNVTVYGLDSFETQIDKTESTGKFFNPIMAVFITSASRLILAASEALIEKNSGQIAYCDTDSMFVSPEHVKIVQEFFKPLNPYLEDIEMFKIEDYEDANKKKHPLDNVKCIAISAKRYVLYDYDEKTDEITIYKYSSHGLGHLKGIDHEQLWKDIIRIIHHPEKRDEILSNYRSRYAVSQLTINNCHLLKRFDTLNENRTYIKKIKPYNFATVGTACKNDSETHKPIIPFLPEVDKMHYDEVPYKEFVDYKTGKKYPNENSLEPQEYWKTLESVLEDYITHEESKLDGITGVLKRKHLEIDKNSIRYIGKESNELEISKILGVSEEYTIEYVNLQKKLRTIIGKLTLKIAEKLGISRREYYYLKSKLKQLGTIKLKEKTLHKLAGFVHF